MGVLVRTVVSLVVAVTSSASTPDATTPTPTSPRFALAAGTGVVGPANWQWPVVGPVIDAFDPPDTPFGAGHRGIDIATPVGTVIVAPEAAKVTFAGKVGGQLFVTLDHGGGVESTYSWLSATLVRKNDVVARGQAIARTGPGHPGKTPAHLHLGVKLNDVYQDPLAYLGPMSVSAYIRLAPD
jgi:murein DD-endopeptidase MepM/ murein hydrolase activator NlpD